MPDKKILRLNENPKKVGSWDCRWGIDYAWLFGRCGTISFHVEVRLLVEVAVEVFGGVEFGLLATVSAGEMATGGGGSTYAISTSPNQ